MATKNTLKIQIMHKKTNFELKILDEVTVEELKYRIERHENINMAYYYLFFDNMNLLDLYNTFTLRRIIEINSNKNQQNIEQDYIFYLISRLDYKEIVDQLNCLKCEAHPYNTAYLFCSSCDLLICDKCKEAEHKSHERVNDQALSLDSYFIKLQQYEIKFKNLFGKSKVSDLAKICFTMENNLMEYFERQKNEIVTFADQMKNIIDKIKNLEITRLEKFVEAGKEKIAEFEEEAGLIFKMNKECSEGLQARKTDLESFSKWKSEQKIEYLKIIQKKNSEMIERSSRIEKVIEKFQNVDEYDIFRLLEANKDFSYAVTFTKLNQIFTKKLQKLEQKIKLEKCNELISRMENIKSRIGNSKVYNKLLNLCNVGSKSIDTIIQPIDLTACLNIFNINERKIIQKDVSIPENCMMSVFPKFHRSININNKIFICGGELDGSIVNYLVEIDGETLDVRKRKGMEFRRSAHTLVNISNLKIVAISGAYGETSCETFNIEKNFWSLLSNVNTDRLGSCALVYCNETIFLFFGKKWDSFNRKWVYVETIERINLYEQYPSWKVLNFKSSSLEVVKNRAFSAIIACPNEKVFMVGGNFLSDNKVEFAENVLEVNVENHTLDAANVVMPKLSCFLDHNFYFHNSNAVSFDNQGSIFIYSVIFNDMWHLENL